MVEKTEVLTEKQLKKLRLKRILKRELGAWGFLLPHFFFFVLFIVIPVVYGFVMSFYRWTLLGSTRFIGLDNYVRIWNDSRFWQSVKNTVMFAVISIPLIMAVSMIFALL
ncbi:MAG: Binding-protein-dependent transport systems inner membrane component, partial [Thermotoga petrophila]